MIHVRPAAEGDVDDIRGIFVASYGEHYAHPEYYDAGVLRRLIFDDEELPATPLFANLDAEQCRTLASICELTTFSPGEAIISAGTHDGKAYLLLRGSADITIDAGAAPVGVVGAGEILGEFSLLRDAPHAASATATTPIEAALIARDPLTALIRRRPDIGLILYHNFAAQLGDKLLRTDSQMTP